VTRETRSRAATKPSLVLCCLFAISVVLSWILCVGGTRRDEMLVGAVVLLLTGIFLYQVWRTETLDVEFQLVDIAQGWRVPGYLIKDVYVITAVLLKDLLGMASAGSFYRVDKVKHEKRHPRQEARDVLTTLYTTMTPNSIVIGIDRRQDRLLFHQLQRSGISKTARALGVRPGAEHP